MRQENKTPLTTLCERLTHHVGVPIGRNHLAKISQDNLNFNAQKDNANGFKTMRSYLFHLEKVAWEQANG